MDSGTAFVKYVLFIFNTLVSILGILAIVYGVLIEQSLGAITVENESDFTTQSLFSMGLIAIGSIVVFISFFGCCGAIREDVCMTMCYAVFMLMLLILQIVLVIFLWINKEQITASLSNLIDRAWDRESREAGVFEAIQKSLHCCGASGAADYALIFKVPPSSCCDYNNICTPFNYYGGCKQKVVEFMSVSSDQAKYFGLGLIIVELVGFVFACCLANNIRNYKRRNAY